MGASERGGVVVSFVAVVIVDNGSLVCVSVPLVVFLLNSFFHQEKSCSGDGRWS